MTIDGTVNSSIQIGSREINGTAQAILQLVAVLLLSLLMLVILARGAIIILFPLGLLLAVLWVTRGFDSAVGMGRWAGGKAASAAGTLAKPRGMPGGVQHADLEVTSFRLLGTNGRSYDCELIGRLNGPAPRLQDDVTVEGKVRRDGILQISTLRNAATGVTIKPHRPLGVRMKQSATWVLIGLVALVAVAIAAGAK